MELDDEASQAEMEQQDQTAPGSPDHDPLTYDPTQEAGTDAWQLSVRASMERNAQERRN